MTHINKIFWLLIFTVLLSITASNAFATPFIVDTTLDAYDANPGDGICDDGTGACTLRAAAQEANSQTGQDLILFTSSGGAPYTINVSSYPTNGGIEITDDVLIDGGSLGDVNIIAGAENKIFYITGSDTDVVLNRLMMTSPVGAIELIEANLVINESYISNSGSYDFSLNGGAIQSSFGSLTINDSELAGNRANYGGAIDSYSTLVFINNSNISNNQAISGGAICIGGINYGLEINDSNLSNNSAVDFGGVISTYWGTGVYDIIIAGSIIDSNEAGSGGAFHFYNTPSVFVKGSMITNNVANFTGYAQGGGAIYVYSSSSGPGLVLNLIGSILSYNESNNHGGGIFFSSHNTNQNVLEITGSTLSHNTAQLDGGALYSLGIFGSSSIPLALDLTVSNSNIEFNQANNNAAMYLEGAEAQIIQSGINENVSTYIDSSILEIKGGELDIENTTLSSNTAFSTISLLDDLTPVYSTIPSIVNLHSVTIAQNSGHGIVNKHAQAQFFVTSSIIAENGSDNCYGVFTSQGYNLIDILDSGVCLGFSSFIPDFFGSKSKPLDPMFTPLDYYGYDTRSHELDKASPAQGSSDDCLAEDQVGKGRSLPCTIGAREM